MDRSDIYFYNSVVVIAVFYGIRTIYWVMF